MHMKQYQEEVDAWFKAKGWSYLGPNAVTVRLFEECGEFARLVNHVYGPKKKKLEEEQQDMEEELGDIMYTLICFANSHNISLDDAMQRSLDKEAGRGKDRLPP